MVFTRMLEDRSVVCQKCFGGFPRNDDPLTGDEIRKFLREVQPKPGEDGEIDVVASDVTYKFSRFARSFREKGIDTQNLLALLWRDRDTRFLNEAGLADLQVLLADLAAL
ncbi:uncharacterized protein JCM6883_002279 [Sporobolomyces salmoneus]|uniref:uncharacterized protein n=1 Tax=Sporobolomyces salmoneus TaxID=183962 RepID=UPI00316E4ACD